MIHLKAERDVLRMVNHPGLVNMLGAFQDAVCVYFVMEYVSGGEFFRQLRIREKYASRSSCHYVQLVHVHSSSGHWCTVGSPLCQKAFYQACQGGVGRKVIVFILMLPRTLQTA